MRDAMPLVRRRVASMAEEEEKGEVVDVVRSMRVEVEAEVEVEVETEAGRAKA